MAQRLGTYLASLSVLIIMIGALLFWAGGRFVETGGERDERRGPVGGRDNPGNTPGDVKADPAFRSTAEEVEYRTGNPDQPAFPGTQTAARDRPGALKDDPTELVGHRVRLREVPVDKAVDAMVQGHQEVLGKLRAQSAGAHAAGAPGGGQGEQALTQWATKALPTVQQHLERAQELQKKVAK